MEPHRLVEHNTRIESSKVLKGSHRLGRNLEALIGGRAVAVVWDDPMPGCMPMRSWFECPQCHTRCKHLYLPWLACRRCCRLDYSAHSKRTFRRAYPFRELKMYRQIARSLRNDN